MCLAYVAIRGAFHFTFSDDGALLKSSIVRGVLRMVGKLGIDGRRQLAVTAYCLRTFFDAYLEGAPGARSSISSPLYPEIQVLECVAAGRHNREIGERLFISEETVKVHLKRIMSKLGARDRTHAVTIANRRGVVRFS